MTTKSSVPQKWSPNCGTCRTGGTKGGFWPDKAAGWSPQTGSDWFRASPQKMPKQIQVQELIIGLRGSDKGHKVAEISTLIFLQKIRIDLESPSPVVVCDKGDVE